MGKKRKSKDLDENSDPLAEAVKRFLRSVLLSAKNGIQATRLQDEYTQFVGKPIPFKQLKFDSLDDFIRSIPDVVERKWATGKLYYVAVADENTQHIKDMVAKQKDSKPKSKRKMEVPQTLSHKGQFGQFFTAGCKSKVMPNRSESTGLSHVEKTHIKIPADPVKGTATHTPLDSFKEVDSKIPIDLKAAIRAVLETSENGMQWRYLQSEFKRLVGREIPFYKLGYISLYNFMKSMPDVATIERRDGYNYYVAVPLNPSYQYHKAMSVLTEKQNRQSSLKENHDQQSSLKKNYNPQSSLKEPQSSLKENHNPQTSLKENHNPQSSRKESLNPKPSLKENRNLQSDIKGTNHPQQPVVGNPNPWETTDLSLLKAAIRAVLDSFKYGILASKLHDEFLKLIGKTIPHHSFGYSSLYSFMESLTDVVRIERRNEDIFYVVIPQKPSGKPIDEPIVYTEIDDSEDDDLLDTSEDDLTQHAMGPSENPMRATNVVLNTNVLINLRKNLCSCCKDVFDDFEFHLKFAHGTIQQPPQHNVRVDCNRYRSAEEINRRFAPVGSRQPPQYMDNDGHRYAQQHQKKVSIFQLMDYYDRLGEY